jgi:hypothetical protein
MHPSSADVENEFADIAREVAYLSVRLAHCHTHAPVSGSQAEWEAILILASAAEKIFTGCERVMERLAAHVDRSRIVHAEGWHGALLARMAEPFQGRGAVISAECHGVLNKLRAFRHRERNTYGVQLDYQIVVERVREAIAGFELFCRDVRYFLNDDSSD